MLQEPTQPPGTLWQGVGVHIAPCFAMAQLKPIYLLSLIFTLMPLCLMAQPKLRFSEGSLWFGTVAGEKTLNYQISSTLAQPIKVTAPLGYKVALAPSGPFEDQLTLPPGGGTVHVRLQAQPNEVYLGALQHNCEGAWQDLRVAGAGPQESPRFFVLGHALRFDRAFFDGPHGHKSYLVYGFGLAGPVQVTGVPGFRLGAAARQDWVKGFGADSLILEPNAMGDLPYTTLQVAPREQKPSEAAGYITHQGQDLPVQVMGLTARPNGSLPQNPHGSVLEGVMQQLKNLGVDW